MKTKHFGGVALFSMAVFQTAFAKEPYAGLGLEEVIVTVQKRE